MSVKSSSPHLSVGKPVRTPTLKRITYRFSPTPRIQVVAERNPGALSSAIGIFVGCGSRRESAPFHGVTHLAEHLFFKGTSRHSAEQISSKIERHGGEINAFTDREATAFHTWIPVEQTEMALELLFEMLFDSLIDPREFEREKHVVLQELRSYADSPDEEFSDRILEVAFNNHPLGKRIAGFPQVVKNLSHKKVVKYIEEQFLRSKIVVSIVSPLKEEKVKEIVRRTLKKSSQWRWGHLLKKSARRFVETPPQISSDLFRRSEMKRFDADQVQFGFMFPAVSLKDKNEVLWSALGNLLGGGSSSLLFREVREKRGLAYTTQAQLYSFSDVGMLQGYLATDPKKLLEAVAVAGETCRRLAAGVTLEDLEFVKSMMEGSVYMSYDGINNRMESLARQELIFGKPYTVREAIREVHAINKKDFDKAAQTLLSTPCFFALGPVSQRDLARIHKAWKGNS